MNGLPPDISEAELRAFVGRNVEYYFAKWRAINYGAHGKVALNVAAAVFGIFWMLYRKFYLLLIGVVSVLVIGMTLQGWVLLKWLQWHDVSLVISGLLPLAFVLILGGWANYWYYLYACESIRSIKRHHPDPVTQMQLIQRKGGARAWPLAVLMVLLVAVVTAAKYLV